jgi:ABC-type transport system involved in multi-copper enzyme maturation permease subunit
VKGIILAVLSLLGGTLAAFVMALIEEIRKSDLASKMSSEDMHELQVRALSETFNDKDMGRSLADAPGVLLVTLGLTIWLTPLLVALMGFDTIAGDLQHKSVRYWTLRSRRWSYFCGKWMGLWATVSLVTLFMDVLIWVVCVARGQATFGATFGWGFRFWLTSLPMSAAWCGIATLVSSLVRSPILALLSTFGAFFVLWVLWFIGKVFLVKDMSSGSWLQYLYPNHYDVFLLHPFAHKVMTGLGVCFGMAAAYIATGSYFFQRRDV